MNDHTTQGATMNETMMPTRDVFRMMADTLGARQRGLRLENDGLYAAVRSLADSIEQAEEMVHAWPLLDPAALSNIAGTIERKAAILIEDAEDLAGVLEATVEFAKGIALILAEVVKPGAENDAD